MCCDSWGRKESDMTERLHFHFSFSHPFMTTGKTITLARWAFVGKALFLSRLVIAFLPTSKCLLISWLQSPSAVTLKVKVKSLSHVRLFATPWAVAYQALLSLGFSRQ